MEVILFKYASILGLSLCGFVRQFVCCDHVLRANHKMVLLFYALCDEDFFIFYFCDRYGENIA